MTPPLFFYFAQPLTVVFYCRYIHVFLLIPSTPLSCRNLRFSDSALRELLCLGGVIGNDGGNDWWRCGFQRIFVVSNFSVYRSSSFVHFLPVNRKFCLSRTVFIWIISVSLSEINGGVYQYSSVSNVSWKNCDAA